MGICNYEPQKSLSIKNSSQQIQLQLTDGAACKGRKDVPEKMNSQIKLTEATLTSFRLISIKVDQQYQVPSSQFQLKCNYAYYAFFKLCRDRCQ